MRNWEDTCKGDGANLVCESVICNDAPDDDALEACKSLVHHSLNLGCKYSIS